MLAWLALAGVALLAACGEDDATATPVSTAARAATTVAPAKTTGTVGATSSPAAATAAAGATTVRIGDTSLGKVLVDEQGMTLYTFKNDPPNEGKSVCNGNCASIWPPVPAPASGTATKPAEAAGAIVAITRDDGSKQVAYAGQPLYRYAPDTAAGETKGEGVGGNWFVARP
jgi:predicted lipoprotein with Yx(FWY)xxD motif